MFLIYVFFINGVIMYNTILILGESAFFVRNGGREGRIETVITLTLLRKGCPVLQCQQG